MLIERYPSSHLGLQVVADYCAAKVLGSEPQLDVELVSAGFEEYCQEKLAEVQHAPTATTLPLNHSTT